MGQSLCPPPMLSLTPTWVIVNYSTLRQDIIPIACTKIKRVAGTRALIAAQIAANNILSPVRNGSSSDSKEATGRISLGIVSEHQRELKRKSHGS